MNYNNNNQINNGNWPYKHLNYNQPFSDNPSFVNQNKWIQNYNSIQNLRRENEYEIFRNYNQNIIMDDQAFIPQGVHPKKIDKNYDIRRNDNSRTNVFKNQQNWNNIPENYPNTYENINQSFQNKEIYNNNFNNNFNNQYTLSNLHSRVNQQLMNDNTPNNYVPRNVYNRDNYSNLNSVFRNKNFCDPYSYSVNRIQKGKSLRLGSSETPSNFCVEKKSFDQITNISKESLPEIKENMRIFPEKVYKEQKNKNISNCFGIQPTFFPANHNNLIPRCTLANFEDIESKNFIKKCSSKNKIEEIDEFQPSGGVKQIKNGK